MTVPHMNDETRDAVRAAMLRSGEVAAAGREAMASIVPAVKEAGSVLADLGAAFAGVRLPPAPDLSGLRHE